MTGDKKWYEWDDINVRSISEPLVSGKGPYVLFYFRTDIANK